MWLFIAAYLIAVTVIAAVLWVIVAIVQLAYYGIRAIVRKITRN